MSRKEVCTGNGLAACSRCIERNLDCQYERKRRASTTPPVRSVRQSTDRADVGTAPIPIRQSVETFSDPFNTNINDESWLAMLGLDSMSSTLDWGMSEPELNIFDVLNTHAPNSPSWNGFHAPASHEHSPEELHGVPAEIPDGQPLNSPWVCG